ncbi:MAG: Histidine kinase [Dehalococcoidia bacterium]|nr:Histidine kinase [Dehalococcoidia bacterium]
MSSQGAPSRGEPRGRGLRVRWAMMGLRWRLTLYLGVALLVLLIAFTVLGLQAVNRARSQAFSQQIHLTSTMAGGLDQQFDSISSHVHVHFPSAPSPALAAPALAYLYEHLVHFENLGYFQVRSVRLVDAKGELLAAMPQNTPDRRETLPSQEVLQQAMSEGRTIVIPSRFAREGEATFAAMVIPLLPFLTSDEGMVIVVDTVGLGTVEYLSTPEKSEDGHPYGIELVAADGFVVASSGGDARLGVMTEHYAHIRGFLERGETGAAVHHKSHGGQLPDHIVAVAPLGNAPFFLVAEEPLGLLLDWPQQLRRQAIILGGIAVLIVLGLGWIVEQVMVRPVVALGRWSPCGNSCTRRSPALTT